MAHRMHQMGQDSTAGGWLASLRLVGGVFGRLLARPCHSRHGTYGRLDMALLAPHQYHLWMPATYLCVLYILNDTD